MVLGCFRDGQAIVVYDSNTYYTQLLHGETSRQKLFHSANSCFRCPWTPNNAGIWELPTGVVCCRLENSWWIQIKWIHSFFKWIETINLVDLVALPFSEPVGNPETRQVVPCTAETRPCLLVSLGLKKSLMPWFPLFATWLSSPNLGKKTVISQFQTVSKTTRRGSTVPNVWPPSSCCIRNFREAGKRLRSSFLHFSQQRGRLNPSFQWFVVSTFVSVFKIGLLLPVPLDRNAFDFATDQQFVSNHFLWNHLGPFSQ